MSNIFIDRTVFTEQYIPEKILFRNKQINDLVAWMNPSLNRARGCNVLCLGDYGTGKTSTVSYVVKNVNNIVGQQVDGFKVYWVNCAEYTSIRQNVTLNKIFIRWLKSEGITVYPTSPTVLITDLMKEVVEKYNSTVFVFDEIDEYLRNPNNDFSRMAYLISRSLKNTIAVMITNKFWVGNYLQTELDARTIDTFSRNMQTIGFSDYSRDELYDILKARCEIGLKPTAYNENILHKIADISFNQGLKARGVINLTLWAGELAERNGYGQIETWMIETVTKHKHQIELENIISTMDTPSRAILYYLCKNKNRGWIKEQEILDWFQNNETKLKLLRSTSKYVFHHAVVKLRGMEIVEREIVGRGRGRGTYGQLRISPAYSDMVCEVLLDGDNK